MVLEKMKKKNAIIAVAGIIGCLLIVFLAMDKEPEQMMETPEKKPSATVAQGDISKPKVDIDYKELDKKGTPLERMMDARKKKLGLDASVDMVVESNESFTLGDRTVSMQRILSKATTKKGEIFQQSLDGKSKRLNSVKQYGVYVVQPGDNIWNIHFNLLKEYYEMKGVKVGSKADEPVKLDGRSSGVGKLLKFSENMVIIYNLKDDQVAEDINLLQPLSKVIVYNMNELFTLLEEIDYDTVNRIQFDGENIWIPAKKS